MNITCPYCKYNGPPTIEKKVSEAGWVVFVVLLLFCIVLCWIPFVIDGLQKEVRKCPSCGVTLG